MSSGSIFMYVILIGLMYLLLKNVFQMNIVAIIGIILVVVIIYMYSFSNSDTLQDLQNGQTTSQIAADTLADNGTNTPATNFAYSIWFFVNDFNYRYGEKKVIFGRMEPTGKTDTTSIEGLSGKNPCPVVYLGANENTVTTALTYQSDTATTSTSSNIDICEVANVPIQKWVNLVISVYGRTLDTYIDGKLVRTCLLTNIAKVNSDTDVYVTPSGGFDGWTSKFQYFANALNPQEAYNIYAAGYGNGMFSNTYQIQLSLIQNGNVESSTTI